MGEGIRELAALRVGSVRVFASRGGDPGRRLPALRSERGQGVVEFAMVLPFLAAIAFILITFGKTLFFYIDLTHVANEGARIAAVSQATLPNDGGGTPYTSLAAYLCDQIGATNKDLRKGSGAVSKAQVTVTYNSAGSTNTGDPVTVAITTHYSWLQNAFTKWFNIPTPGIDITGSATMRIENPVAATGTTVITGGTC